MFFLYWHWNDGRTEDQFGNIGWRRARYSTFDEALAQANADLLQFGPDLRQAPIRIEDEAGAVLWEA